MSIDNTFTTLGDQTDFLCKIEGTGARPMRDPYKFLEPTVRCSDPNTTRSLSMSSLYDSKRVYFRSENIAYLDQLHCRQDKNNDFGRQP